MTPPIVIYQMGKVGSSALFVMFDNAQQVDGDVFHVHTLRDDTIGRNIINNVDWNDKRHIVDSIRLRRLLARNPMQADLTPEQKWKWITPVRDPIARNLSAFFQNHAGYIPQLIERWDAGDLSVEEIRDTFIQKYDHTIPLRWFDDEYKALFGFNAYEVPFQPDEGYLVIRTNAFDILLLRSEDMDRLPAELFDQYVGVEGLKLDRVLEGSRRPYADVYEAFKQRVRFPQKFVEVIYDTPYMKTFYSADEIADLTKKWVEGK